MNQWKLIMAYLLKNFYQIVWIMKLFPLLRTKQLSLNRMVNMKYLDIMSKHLLYDYDSIFLLHQITFNLDCLGVYNRTFYNIIYCREYTFVFEVWQKIQLQLAFQMTGNMSQYITWWSHCSDMLHCSCHKTSIYTHTIYQ